MQTGLIYDSFWTFMYLYFFNSLVRLETMAVRIFAVTRFTTAKCCRKDYCACTIGFCV